TSLLENVGLMDLGFRSAVLKYTAHYRALNEPGKVNETINTGLAFSGSGCVLAMLAALFFAPSLTRFENVRFEYASVFTQVLMMVGVVYSLSSVFNLLTASLEGFQRFDLTSRIWIVQTATRSSAIVVVLSLGHGLRAMGEAALVAMALNY